MTVEEREVWGELRRAGGMHHVRPTQRDRDRLELAGRALTGVLAESQKGRALTGVFATGVIPQPTDIDTPMQLARIAVALADATLEVLDESVWGPTPTAQEIEAEKRAQAEALARREG